MVLKSFDFLEPGKGEQVRGLVLGIQKSDLDPSTESEWFPVTLSVLFISLSVPRPGRRRECSQFSFLSR